MAGFIADFFAPLIFFEGEVADIEGEIADIEGTVADVEGAEEIMLEIEELFDTIFFMVEVGIWIEFLIFLIIAILTLILCGIQTFFRLPKCLKWYLLNLVLYVLYLPFRFFFWIFGLSDLEKKVWDIIYDIDDDFHEFTKYHFAHFPDDVIKDCYCCTFPSFPGFPDNPLLTFG